MKRYILTIPILILLMAGVGWAYEIGIGGVTIIQRGNDITVTVLVELGTSGVISFTKEVSASVDRNAVADWKVELREQLKSKVIGVNTDKIASETLQANEGVIKTWLEGQVNP